MTVPVDYIPVYRFPQIYKACEANQLSARLYQFDGGETVEIVDAQGRQALRVTGLYGDPTATDQAAMWLMQQGIATVFDLAD